MTLRILLTIPLLLMALAGFGQQAGPAYSMMLQEIADAPQADRIEKDITKLVSFGTRHTLSDTVSETRGIGAARRWIKKEFERISAECGNCLEVIYVQDTVMNRSRVPGTANIVNVIAIQRGTADPDRVVMMSGDIDSRISDVMNATDDSPGANDNASGVAGAIEAARVLSKYKFPGTIVYAALSGEEQGLLGGEILAKWSQEQGWKIKAVLNNDMIGNIEGINGVVNNSVVRVFSEGTRAVETDREARIRRFTGGEVDSPSRNLARYIDHMSDLYFPNLDVMMIYRLDRFGRGGHHRPFNDIGAAAVRLMETYEHYDRQHQDLRTEDGIKYGDVLEKVDFDYAATVTGLNAVTLAGLASAPAPPKNVSIEGAVSASTTLKWEPAGDENITGYKVYWRLTTSPVWQYSRMVGDVDSYELENVIIDNYFFGVSTVGEDGAESPVVFPGPAGSFGE
ncbi:M28 family peptidase [Roseivirga sp. BDSF3-8]|uniref:M28 family peptidase n=1 Tax=Roseivirga sp. BDSF3-8 TaxID=3241598 RepID=UPI003531E44E